MHHNCSQKKKNLGAGTGAGPKKLKQTKLQSQKQLIKCQNYKKNCPVCLCSDHTMTAHNHISPENVTPYPHSKIDIY